MARFKQAAQEEAAAEARGRGRQFGRGSERAAPARAPMVGRGRGRGPTVGVTPRIFGLAHSEEEVDEEDCGRTNLNYTGSSTRVHSRGLQRTSNGIIPWPVG
jgi:hypothetical protein